MTPVESKHSLDIQLTMRTPNQDNINVHLKEVLALGENGQILAVIIGFELSPTTYNEIVNPSEYFNSTIKRRIGNPKLTANTPIEFKTRLVADYVNLVNGNGDRASDVAEFLKTASNNSDLLHTENWLTLEVKQEVPVPPNVGSGTLKEGYRIEQ